MLTHLIIPFKLHLVLHLVRNVAVLFLLLIQNVVDVTLDARILAVSIRSPLQEFYSNCLNSFASVGALDVHKLDSSLKRVLGQCPLEFDFLTLCVLLLIETIQIQTWNRPVNQLLDAIRSLLVPCRF